jgi:hypothetical protein
MIMKTYIISALAYILFLGSSNTLLAQGSGSKSDLLSNYYAIKNALVSGDAATASKQATAFSAALAAVDTTKLPAAEQSSFKSLQPKLAAGSKAISGTKDISKQRELFISFSSDMISLAKTVKLGSHPIYIDYCPMKKASWLSAEQAIKNPYYGSSMLSCGSVKETLK